MDRLSTYVMFQAVADGGSFSLAARRLGVSPQAVSRGIAALEQSLGVTLFHRSTRAVALTAQGAALLPRIARVLSDLAEAELSVSGARIEPAGQLHVTAPVTFGQLHVLPVVIRLLADHPRLDIRLALFDRNVRIVEEGIDVAVRIGALADSSLRAIPLGAVNQMLVASPAYVAAHGMPATPADLSAHTLIASTGPRGAGEWRFDGRPDTDLRARFSVNSVAAALAAAEAGVGIANLLSYQVARSLREGRLVEVLAPVKAEPLPVHLLFEAGRANAAAVRVFLDAMRARARHGWH